MKILLISEEEEAISKLQKLITHILPNFEFSLATNLTQSMEIICNESPCSFYIIDSDITSFSLTDILQTINDFAGSKPILFTGHYNSFKGKISQQNYDSHEKNNFIPKPYEHENFLNDLKEALSKIIEFVEKENRKQDLETIDPKDFIKLKLRSFYLFNAFKYDIYLEVTSTRFLKILPAGTKYSHSFLSKYAKRNIKYFQIRKTEHLKYLDEEVQSCINEFTKILKLSGAQYVFLLKSITILHQYLQALGHSEKAQILLELIVNYILKIHKEKNKLLQHLESYPYYYEGISSKSLLSALMNLSMSNVMQWDSETTKARLVAASILQDYYVEDDSLSKIIRLKDSLFKNLNEDEKKKFEIHPVKAAHLATSFSKYPDISSILENHHELPSKRGFPNQIAIGSLNQLSIVFNISTYFAALIDGKAFDEINFKDTFRIIKRDFEVGYARDIFLKYSLVLK
ncbi:MAG: hypothetical protein N4A33_04260 [Bacteriovoracaceae bacterium]|nr:hypothetical protein [Bacteriovoracaceae bacterium]